MITCDSCRQKMKLIKSLKTKEKGKVLRKYRVRRFHCDLCNISKTIYGDGKYDEELLPEYAKEDSEKMYKKQEDNEK